MNWIILMVIVVFTEAMADIVAKQWSLSNKFWISAVAIGIYILVNIFWLFALKSGAGLGRGAVVFSVGSAILGVLIGYLIYKEPFSHLEIIGVIFGIASFTLIFWEE